MKKLKVIFESNYKNSQFSIKYTKKILNQKHILYFCTKNRKQNQNYKNILSHTIFVWSSSEVLILSGWRITK